MQELLSALVLQVLASFRWPLHLGDIKGAFLESPGLDRRGGKLYASQPSQGLFGVARGVLLEIVGYMYGLGDAPRKWYETFAGFLEDQQWQKSAFDPCVFFDGQQNICTAPAPAAPAAPRINARVIATIVTIIEDVVLVER